VYIADKSLPELLVSVTHTEGAAFALATLSGNGRPGIDAERVREREPSFAGTFLQPHELAYLASCSADKVNVELTRLWSAKEAMYKACGGAIEMSSFKLTSDKPGADEIEMTGGGRTNKAYVITHADMVLACTLADAT